jgi:hypothetical protein
MLQSFTEFVGYAVVGWDTHWATSWKATSSIPDGAIGIFHWPNPSCRGGSMAGYFEVSADPIPYRSLKTDSDSMVLGAAAWQWLREGGAINEKRNRLRICHSFVCTRVCVIEGLWIGIFCDEQLGLDSFTERVNCTSIKIAKRCF